LKNRDIFLELDNISKIDNLFDNKLDNKFDILSKYISNKKIINNIQEILNRYYRYFTNTPLKLNAKLLLLSWLINSCTDIIVGKIDNFIKYNLLIYSRLIIKNINDLLLDRKYIITFNKNLIKYTIYITIFIEQDKIDKLEYFTHEWMSLEKAKNEINDSEKYNSNQKIEIINNINKNKIMIETYTKYIKKNHDFNYYQQIIDISHKLSKQMIIKHKQTLYNEICSKDYKKFILIINEIKQFLIILNKNIKEEIDEIIDINYYINMLNNDICDFDIVTNLFNYIYEKLIKHGSERLEEITKNKYLELLLEKKDIMLFISNILVFLLELIKEIKNEICDFRLFSELIS